MGIMETKVLNYRIIVTSEYFKGKTVYNAFCSALGVADWGKTVEEALKNIKCAMECHIEALVKNHESLPHPETKDTIVTTTSVAISVPHGLHPSFV